MSRAEDVLLSYIVDSGETPETLGAKLSLIGDTLDARADVLSLDMASMGGDNFSLLIRLAGPDGTDFHTAAVALLAEVLTEMQLSSTLIVKVPRATTP